MGGFGLGRLLVGKVMVVWKVRWSDGAGWWLGWVRLG